MSNNVALPFLPPGGRGGLPCLRPPTMVDADMPMSPRLPSRRRIGAKVAGCLLGALLAVSMESAPAAAASALVGSWAARLDQRAAELESAPKVQATRVGGGPVMKKGDGGMIEVVIPGVEPPAPPFAAETEASAAAPLEPLEPLAPAVIRVRAPSADRVGRLAQRLVELGYLPADQWADAYDDNVEAAVRAFQTAEGLASDGKVGEVTRLALDRTPAQAAALMRRASAAMQASRTGGLPDTLLLVNLPSQMVAYVEKGQLVFTMRAVVGRPSRRTPLLKDRVTSVTINPTWTVPPTVLVEDKLPILRKKGNSGIKNATVYLDGVEVVPETVNWWGVTPGRIRIVQKPGDDNALGRFRFNLTNGDGIFLHGTNDPRLFSRDLRAASSGCVRLEDARLLADRLLATAKVGPETVSRFLDGGETKTIRLPTAVPVHFVSWTASVEANGTVRVHPEIYEDPAPPSNGATRSTARPAKPTPPAPAGTAVSLPAPPAATPAAARM